MDKVRKIVLWTTGVILAMILISSFVLCYSVASLNMPAIPSQTNSTNTNEQDAKAKEVSNYKEIIQSLQAQRTNIYDFVVIRTLLPLFNTIVVSVLSYVFARTFLEVYKIHIAAKKT